MVQKRESERVYWYMRGYISLSSLMPTLIGPMNDNRLKGDEMVFESGSQAVSRPANQSNKQTIKQTINQPFSLTVPHLEAQVALEPRHRIVHPQLFLLPGTRVSNEEVHEINVLLEQQFAALDESSDLWGHVDHTRYVLQVAVGCTVDPEEVMIRRRRRRRRRRMMMREISSLMRLILILHRKW